MAILLFAHTYQCLPNEHPGTRKEINSTRVREKEEREREREEREGRKRGEREREERERVVGKSAAPYNNY